ncbi:MULTISPECIES: hypothetical protein [Arthrospira]|nr:MULTISPECIES: hypothetical protein [Arthrospira]MBD2668402.1 hypothetical protein [Arthrospira platensis FACHB-439]MBD2711449.1 hypothetical protein [Arthrospira platensis FACHB-835]MDF2209342.1 hypothetical protein [Arthrospira platensis NCB002]MDT9182006.1 hypothetical protein [Limnospira sp. PMC 289.06]MDT9294115.1 hypothetical protein [Arthrospira platensis PCC 7345]MDT9309653.1 hypothetical protein [Limnospira sp. Paracas R14]QQW30994.1 hypothetical protein AP9108_10535 [Arthrospira 
MIKKPADKWRIPRLIDGGVAAGSAVFDEKTVGAGSFVKPNSPPVF